MPLPPPARPPAADAGDAADARDSADGGDGGDGSETCPGCGAVLAFLPDTGPAHPGASASCARLFEVTVRGLREDATADPSVVPLVRLADAAYDAQHPVAGDRGRLDAALAQLAATVGTRPAGPASRTAGTAPPGAWRTTIADAAADLDVIDLPVLIASWARSVHEDWTTSFPIRR